MRSRTYGRFEKSTQNFTWKIQTGKVTSLEDAQFPVSVRSDIEVVRWKWGRSEIINKCTCLAEYGCFSASIKDTLASFCEHHNQLPGSTKDGNLFRLRQKNQLLRKDLRDQKNSDFLICLSNNIYKYYFSYRPKHKLKFLEEIRQISN